MAARRISPKPAPRASSPTPADHARDWMFAFLVAFAHGGNVTQAARVAKVARRTVYLARETDREFAAGWEDALAEAADRIRAEVTRRAIEGWEEPIIGSLGNYCDGHLLGVDGKPMYLRKFDNGLLARLAQAHCPEFREKGPVAATVNVTIQISPEKLRQVQERKRSALERMTNGRN